MPQLPVVFENVSPMMDEAQTHVATARLAFREGALHQLFWPCDGATHDPEWRPVPTYDGD